MHKKWCRKHKECPSLTIEPHITTHLVARVLYENENRKTRAHVGASSSSSSSFVHHHHLLTVGNRRKVALKAAYCGCAAASFSVITRVRQPRPYGVHIEKK